MTSIRVIYIYRRYETRKNAFKKLTALLLVLILVLSSVPIAVSAAEAQLTGNDTDGYSVNVPATGTDTLSLNGKLAGFTFKVYDNGFSFKPKPTQTQRG